MIQITLVPTQFVGSVWPTVAPMIERALHYCGERFRIDDVLEDCLLGTQTLWLAMDDGQIIGCTTISITLYPGGKKALVYEHLAGEDVQRWLSEGDRVCREYARDNGCTILECQGRSGWKPFLEKLGYRQFAVRYECEV